jgi:alkylhydroperoxidase family enzyme
VPDAVDPTAADLATGPDVAPAAAVVAATLRAPGRPAGFGAVADQLDLAVEAAYAVADPVLLELVRLRIAQMLGSTADVAHRSPAAVAAGLDEATVAELAQWPSSERFDATARACLALCEHYVLDVASIDDATVLAVGDALGPTGLSEFVNAMLVVEQRIRLRLMWERLGLTAGAHGTGE